MSPSSSAMSNSSSISPTICSSTSSMVMRPADAAELVDHDRQVVAVAAEFAQQVVQALALGHERRRTQQRAQVQARRPLQLEQVLGHQDADDVLAIALVHRKRECAVSITRCRMSS
jgi:Holliday junction resolvasome RuvABC endonuclease subunit